MKFNVSTTMTTYTLIGLLSVAVAQDRIDVSAPITSETIEALHARQASSDAFLDTAEIICIGVVQPTSRKTSGLGQPFGPMPEWNVYPIAVETALKGDLESVIEVRRLDPPYSVMSYSWEAGDRVLLFLDAPTQEDPAYVLPEMPARKAGLGHGFADLPSGADISARELLIQHLLHAFHTSGGANLFEAIHSLTYLRNIFDIRLQAALWELSTHEDPWIAAEALIVLLRNDQDTAAEPLLTLLELNPFPEIAPPFEVTPMSPISFPVALLYIRDRRLSPRLINLAQQSDLPQDVREGALTAVMVMQDERVIPALIRLLDDASPEMRRQAAGCLYTLEAGDDTATDESRSLMTQVAPLEDFLPQFEAPPTERDEFSAFLWKEWWERFGKEKYAFLEDE